jgi:nucleotide-binding universal stress UspA family protein
VTAYNIPPKDRYTIYPNKLIKALVKKLDLKGLKIEVLVEKSLSLTKLINKIVIFSKKNKSDLILIATKSKVKFPGIVLGSFAETMIHLSICDLIIFREMTNSDFEVPNKILYAFDFSPKGRAGLERAILYSKKWNSKLIIVHVPIPEIGIPTDTFEITTNKAIENLKKFLIKEKVENEIFVDYENAEVTDKILKIAKLTNADIIAVAAQANKLKALLGGSVTRKVIRESLQPVLVFKV